MHGESHNLFELGTSNWQLDIVFSDGNGTVDCFHAKLSRGGGTLSTLRPLSLQT